MKILVESSADECRRHAMPVVALTGLLWESLALLFANTHGPDNSYGNNQRPHDTFQIGCRVVPLRQIERRLDRRSARTHGNACHRETACHYCAFRVLESESGPADGDRNQNLHIRRYAEVKSSKQIVDQRMPAVERVLSSQKAFAVGLRDVDALQYREDSV
jgi:hypothetical protein